jgi:hypothetical protein
METGWIKVRKKGMYAAHKPKNMEGEHDLQGESWHARMTTEDDLRKMILSYKPGFNPT